MNKSASFAAACLGASLATAWAPAEAEASMDFRISATGLTLIGGLHALTVINGDMLVDGSVSSIPDDGGSTVIRSGGVGWAGTLLLGKPDDFASRSFEVFGLVTDSFNVDHVVVGFPNSASILGRSFESVFGTSTSEDQIAALIRGAPGRRQSADARDLQAFLAAAGVSASQKNGAPISLVEFSNGVDAGSIVVNVSAVPEPSAFAMMLAGAAGLLRRVRRLRW